MKKLCLIALCLVLSSGICRSQGMSTPMLSNASCRVTLAPNATATLGFVVREDGNFLVRAIGPSLAAFGLQFATSVRLSVFEGGNLIAENRYSFADGLGPRDLNSVQAWLDGQNRIWKISRAALAAGAFPAAADEAAVLVHLAPGTYTAVATNDGVGGDALVEVYAVPGLF